MGLDQFLPPMDDRIRKRRRSVRWERGRGRRTMLLLGALVLCSTVAFLWLRSTDAFAVRRITASGIDQISKEQLAEITSSAMGKNLLSLSTDGVKNALLELPYVQAVDIVRAFPDTLEIKVVEYRPVARLQTVEGATWLVSENGTALADNDPTFLPDLPLVVPETSMAILEGDLLPDNLVEVLPLADRLRAGALCEMLPEVVKIKVSAAGCAALVLKDGGELRLGTPEDLDQKMTVAADIVQKCVAQGRVIEYVDASVANRVAVKAK